MTWYTWLATHGGGCTLSQNFSSLALTVWERQCQWVTEVIVEQPRVWKIYIFLDLIWQNFIKYRDYISFSTSPVMVQSWLVIGFRLQRPCKLRTLHYVDCWWPLHCTVKQLLTWAVYFVRAQGFRQVQFQWVITETSCNLFKFWCCKIYLKCWNLQIGTKKK